MANLTNLIEDNFNLWRTEALGNRFSPAAMQMVCEFFEDNCRFIQVEAADRDSDERQIEELTVAQYGAFQRVLENPRVIVSSPAGSGKTMIAEWTANAFKQAEKRVLLLCYNKVLEAWLKKQ